MGRLLKLDRLVMKALAITTNLQLNPSTEKRKTGAKVTLLARCSLPSSSRLITTEVVIADKPEPPAAAAPDGGGDPMGGMGGMGGMGMPGMGGMGGMGMPGMM